MLGGDTAPARIRQALVQQDAHLTAQGRLLLAASSAEQARLEEQVAGLSAELASLAGQIADQRQLVDVAAADYAGAEQVAANSFISRRDMEARQVTVLSRRQQLGQLEQLRASRSAAVAEARRAIAQSGAAAEAQAAGVEGERAVLAQRLAEVELARGYAVTSPVDGVVTALTARLGQAAAPQQQLMMVVPADGEKLVELHVPTSAAGFVRPGQEVRLAVDSFPYQQFGTVPARVAEVSAAAVPREGPDGPVPVYLVTASLPQPWISAFGVRQPLVPGMTLSARVVTEDRSLVEWLFEPLFAVRNR